MMRKFFMFVVALSVALVATSAFAQTSTTGSIEGVVTDPAGAAVKGATVTIALCESSASRQMWTTLCLTSKCRSPILKRMER